MEWLYAWLPLLGCGIMMFVCMRMMTGGGSKNQRDASITHEAAETEALRSRVAELERRLEVEGSSRSRMGERAE